MEREKIRKEILESFWCLVVVMFSVIYIIVKPGTILFKTSVSALLIVPIIILIIINYPFPKKYSHYITLNTVRMLSIPLSFRFAASSEGFLSLGQISIMICSIMIACYGSYWMTNRGTLIFVESKKLDMEKGIIYINAPWSTNINVDSGYNQKLCALFSSILLPIAWMLINIFHSQFDFIFFLSIGIPFLEAIGGFIFGELFWVWKIEKTIKKPLIAEVSEK